MPTASGCSLAPTKGPPSGTARKPSARSGARSRSSACPTAPIPWPIGKRGRAKGLVVYAGLADAVRRESAQAVAHWWGVTPQTVGVWRKALGVGALTEGTRRLKRDHALEPGIAAARVKAVAEAGDPERRRKIAESRRGKPRPPHVIEAMKQGRTGKSHDAETRARMSESHRKRRSRTEGP
jgi:hypothetical protein